MEGARTVPALRRCAAWPGWQRGSAPPRGWAGMTGSLSPTSRS